MQYVRRDEMRQCLLIGSNDEDRRNLGRLIMAHGFELAMAEDAQQAVAISRSLPVDLVVMPESACGCDGFTIIRQMQRCERGAAPKVLVYAERAEAGIIGRAIWSGASECFVKPFDASIIGLKLRQVGAVQPRP